MSVAPTSMIRELDTSRLFELKRHLIFNADPSSESFSLGNEKDFKNTAVKISFNEEILTQFQHSNFEVIPKLKERRWIVACTSLGIYPIYKEHNLNKLMSLVGVEWKVLKISKELYRKIIKDVNIPKRIIYIDVDAKNYERLPDKSKKPKYYPIDNITAINRREANSCCNLL